MKARRRLFAALLVLAGAWESAGATGFAQRELKLGHGEWTVPATLTLPTVHSPVPAVVLVHGSGPGLRDLPVGGSTIFRNLAHGLARQGIAFIRYDKRTTAHTKAFDKLKRRATVDEEFVADATRAAACLMQRSSSGRRSGVCRGVQPGSGACTSHRQQRAEGVTSLAFQVDAEDRVTTVAIVGSTGTSAGHRVLDAP